MMTTMQQRTMQHRTVLRVLAGLVLAALLLAACGSSDDASSGAAEDLAQPLASSTGGDDGGAAGAEVATADQAMSDAFDASFAEAPAATTALGALSADATVRSALDSGGLSQDDGAALQPIDIGRDIIYTATIEIEVDNVGTAATEALQTVERFGGLLFGQQTTTEGVNRTVLTFRVRPQDFQAVVSALGGIGDLRDQTISTDDVTERVVDLQSQIITAAASVERLRNFLDGAVGLEEVARLEEQLLARETNLERLRGQLRTIQDHVDLATITVTLTERVPGPSIELVQTAYRGTDGGISCAGNDRLEVDEGDAITVCLAITNTGDTYLDDIEVTDEGFNLDTGDLVVDDGELDGRLAPGDRVLAHFEAEALDVSTGLEAAVSARVVNVDGDDLGVARVGARGSGFLDVTPDDAPPGFGDSLQAGVDVLAGLWTVILMVAGFALPFVWIIPLGWLVKRLWPHRPEPTSTLPHPEQPATP